MTRLRGLACAIAALAAIALMPISPLPAQANPAPAPISPVPGAAMTVPWAIGGPRIERDGTKHVFQGDWPNMPVTSLRIWDARTAWLNIEPAPGQWAFARLDAFVAKAEEHHVQDIVLVLGGTPAWAAKQQRKTDAPWLGKGSASPPEFWDDWTTFVDTVASRYQGRIKAYEIWNEPNSVTYWSGTAREWATLTELAAKQIAISDPTARVVVGGFSTFPAKTLAKAQAFIKALPASMPRPSAMGFHWYPTKQQLPAGITSTAQALRAATKGTSLSGVPLWLTETNVRGGSSLSSSAQQAAMQSIATTSARAGITRLWWYAWTDLGPPDLIQIYDGTPAARWLEVSNGSASQS
ncbi:MAG: cellulase family glycosylhydrolase [Candidatus Nanopelagicales bacterium]|nr:cellulase family glycosylhydrolase [Candidatus Nanopelagicales bacterium]